MAQHFLLSAAARTLSLKAIFREGEEAAYRRFRRLRWPETVGGHAMDTYHRWMEVVIGPTLAGLPSMSVPIGFNPGGLPMGLQIIGPAQADHAVLQLAYAHEQLTGWVQRCPPPSLQAP